jgi:hypothetical protein
MILTALSFGFGLLEGIALLLSFPRIRGRRLSAACNSYSFFSNSSARHEASSFSLAPLPTAKVATNHWFIQAMNQGNKYTRDIVHTPEVITFSLDLKMPVST